MINTRTAEFRIEAIYDRTTEIMKKIIKHHIGIGNTVITDGWGTYDWILDIIGLYISMAIKI